MKNEDLKFEGTFKNVSEFSHWLTLQPLEYQYWFCARMALRLFVQASIRDDMSEKQSLPDMRATLGFVLLSHFFRQESIRNQIFDGIKEARSFAEEYGVCKRTSAAILNPEERYLHNPERNLLFMNAFAPLMTHLETSGDTVERLRLPQDEAKFDAAFMETLKYEYEQPMAVMPIWPTTPKFTLWKKAHNLTISSFKDDLESYDFWLRWYISHCFGQPLDWTLQLRVFLLPNEDWHQGPAYIAEKIREIEEDLLAEKSQLAETRGPTPEEVSEERAKSLFEKSSVVASSMETLDKTLSYRLDLFQRMEKPNFLPSFASTLSTIPETAQCISQIVSEPARQEGTNQKLAVEVGRLQAQVEQLKKDLKAALDEIEELKKKPWHRTSSVLLGGGAIGALITGLWVLSGEDKTLETRWNKLAGDLEFLCGKIWCDEEDRISEPLRFELPESHEI